MKTAIAQDPYGIGYVSVFSLDKTVQLIQRIEIINIGFHVDYVGFRRQYGEVVSDKFTEQISSGLKATGIPVETLHRADFFWPTDISKELISREV